jgi:hypothetical protein
MIMENRLNWFILLLLSVFSCQKIQKSKQFEEQQRIVISQNTEDGNECEKGKEEAMNDFQKDDFGLYFYGLPNPRFNNWVRLMREEYKLKVRGGGDIIDVEGDCYNKIMNQKIKEKFGKNAFKRIEEKLDSLYEIGLGDRNAEFQGGEEEFLKYIYCNLKDDLFHKEDDIPLIAVKIIIDESGMVQEIEVKLRKYIAEDDTKFEANVIGVLKNMPKWIPAIKNKSPIKYGFIMPIRFDKKMKEKNCD